MLDYTELGTIQHSLNFYENVATGGHENLVYDTEIQGD